MKDNPLSNYLSDIAQERLHKAFVALMIALLIALMITSLAVMVQIGMIAASTWVLGSALTPGFLWLAAHLGMMTLGAPALIALVALSAWFIAACVVEMNNQVFFANLLGLSPKWSTRNSPIFYVVGLSNPREDNLDRAMLYSFMLLTFPIGLLCNFAFWRLANNQDTRKDSSDAGRRPALIIAGLWILNFIYALLSAPFLALKVMLRAVGAVMQAPGQWFKSLGGSREKGYQQFPLEERESNPVRSFNFTVKVDGEDDTYDLQVRLPNRLPEGQSISTPASLSLLSS